MLTYDQQSQKAAYASNKQSSIPSHGGDCALQGQPEGLASSLKRLSDVAEQLVTASYSLRTCFGMAPDVSEGEFHPSSGVKSDIDRCESQARNALCNINMVLEHLRS